MNELYMRRAIELARRGMGYTNPNPMVGAVIVKNGRIIGEGWHERYGEEHAERRAFANLTEPADGADMYVTLEPCCHYGKQPPCTDAVIEHRIKRVFIGSSDPNPLVAGKGVQILRSHGIEVVEGVLKDECDAINEVFFHYITTKTPYVIAKYTMSADGKICTATGDSRWISNDKSRRAVHAMRAQYSGIMVGIGTVLADDPLLTCRTGGKNPARIIVDSHLRLSINSQIAKTAAEVKTYAAYADAPADKVTALEHIGIECIHAPSTDGKVDLTALMQELGTHAVDSVLIEGGGILNYSAFAAGIVNKAHVFIAPKIIGGTDAKTPVEGAGFAQISDCVNMRLTSVKNLDGDIWAEYSLQ